MAELDLPTGPAELLAAVRKPLADHLRGEPNILLGGGTALAARWAHRHSTDVDLFVEPAHYKRLFHNEAQFTRDLSLHAPDARQVDVEPGFLKITFGDAGHVSVSSSPWLTPDPRSVDTVRASGIPVETTAEILAKKLRYRMIHNERIVPRDLYDLAVARRVDPAALQTALSHLKTEHLHHIDTRLHYLGPGWLRRHPEPLLRPASHEDATNAIDIVRHMVQQHIRSRIPPRPDVNPPWER